MRRKIILAGGTGFIGTFFQQKFRELDYDVKIISRQFSHIPWDDHPRIIDALEDAEMLINLAGKSVDCRYNEKNKEEILRSRTETTKILGNAILKCKNPPKLWINSSTATIYRHAEDRPMTEAEGEIGSGFSVNVAKEWEKAFFDFQLPSTRQIALRIAIVLGEHGGVIVPFKNLVRFGLGGVQGPGTQKFSWIHIEDIFDVIRFLQKREDLSGVFNCSSPNPVTNRELMSLLRKAMNRNFGLPTPKWMLEAGAVLMKTETELILKSRWVIPERLEKEGYVFTYRKLEDALKQIIK
ncbi:TIGR01777 family oxidoreductase [Bacillus sp. FJAT-49736]|uniref:TIGR01777 family oxidoreductase n=1 Tax=Bacillus sp. FJAT-49736 TaxID=2833582 RepID=UPI001BC9E383|nr:TIGR01777 family oxidoreductase [Bacillus sp. FJAT-49736]MBS4172760.1 TIGR01777 family oxidoreductase [Bacillus sp. FJAT-49736]